MITQHEDGHKTRKASSPWIKEDMLRTATAFISSIGENFLYTQVSFGFMALSYV
jgi:hypothetical protein